MKVIIAVLAIAAVASAGVVAPLAYHHAPSIIARAPAFDSAVIKSDRIGGNFAYSVAESHAYAQHTPVVAHVTSPVAVSYSAPVVHHAYAAPAVHHVAHGHVAHAGPIAYSSHFGGVRVL